MSIARPNLTGLLLPALRMNCMCSSCIAAEYCCGIPVFGFCNEMGALSFAFPLCSLAEASSQQEGSQADRQPDLKVYIEHLHISPLSMALSFLPASWAEISASSRRSSAAAGMPHAAGTCACSCLSDPGNCICDPHFTKGCVALQLDIMQVSRQCLSKAPL